MSARCLIFCRLPDFLLSFSSWPTAREFSTVRTSILYGRTYIFVYIFALLGLLLRILCISIVSVFYASVYTQGFLLYRFDEDKYIIGKRVDHYMTRATDNKRVSLITNSYI